MRYGKWCTLVAWLIASGLNVFWVEPARGQLYKWVDRQGNVHFTDNPGRIPPEHRSEVAVGQTTPPPGDEAAAASPSDAAAPGDASAPTPPTDLLGRGPDYWQQMARQWATRLQQHRQERDRLQLMHNYTRHLAASTRNTFDRGRIQADLARLEQAIAEAEGQLQEAETMLGTTLPLEARRLGANPDWLKPPGVRQR
jgi:hypothetical protein